MSKFIFDLLEKELATLGIAALSGVQAGIEQDATDHTKGFNAGLLNAFGEISKTIAQVRKTVEATKGIANAEVPQTRLE